ncbi:ABC transporter ATP-binding protein [Myceligenerans pegani]|uniref:ABC transporter ATP-binding protein n=1 Tax=Myceligenerans pegani TaxID=2776917 RepID=A0ABR9N4G7_9MICO|nr:ABC transporter ATP-binding protein [Myceligenerans sp. TRM 65318]MBE1878555.1 ABC transporter ATP-binding protein [Myceligenerans sp. TRM 65318]MBE3020826.1 ABC transporter ATP-binding protein [Myceligenerans sp. TRM 65318]
MKGTLLDIDNLRLTVETHDGPRDILRGVTLSVARGETVGLVGESGCGKSTTARAALQLLPKRAHTTGRITVCGTDVTGEDGTDAAQVHDVRAHRAGMIFQDPRSALNPVRRIGDSATERLRLVHGLPAAQARDRIVALFTEVGLRDPDRLLRCYPHQLSGGMLQRVVIAAALSTGPELLLADEATSALDVTTQAEVLAVLRRLRRERELGVLFITHDLLLAAAYCDRVYVMQDGHVVDEQPAASLFDDPQHPYTRHLAEATPRLPERNTPERHSPVPASTQPIKGARR